jgi:hypothetical protein
MSDALLQNYESSSERYADSIGQDGVTEADMILQRMLVPEKMI